MTNPKVKEVVIQVKDERGQTFCYSYDVDKLKQYPQEGMLTHIPGTGIAENFPHLIFLPYDNQITGFLCGSEGINIQAKLLLTVSLGLAMQLGSYKKAFDMLWHMAHIFEQLSKEKVDDYPSIEAADKIIEHAIELSKAEEG